MSWYVARRNKTMSVRSLCLMTILLMTLTQLSHALDKELKLTEVELADTPEKQAQGLMNRDSLCATCAMLFVYNYPSNDAFWMKETKVSLDIIFMDQKGKIITIHKNTEPLNTNKLYQAPSYFWFVLETNADFAAKHNLQPGDTLDVKKLMLQTKKINK